MNEFGMYPSNNDSVKRWIAERENATARVDLAQTRECCKLLLTQYDPVFSLGIDRDALAVLLGFIQHHDPARLRRECEAFIAAHGIKKDEPAREWVGLTDEERGQAITANVATGLWAMARAIEDKLKEKNHE